MEDGKMEDGEMEDEEDAKTVNYATIIRGMTPAEDGRLLLPPYLDAFREMIKFLRSLGPLFHFVSTDVSTKVESLQRRVEGPSGRHYLTLQSMVAHERDADLLTPAGGCWTLIRLHRALAFVMRFVGDLGNESLEEPLGRRTSRLYKEVFSPYHPKFLVKTFSGILLFLPERRILVERITRGKEEQKREFLRCAPLMVHATQLMHSATQQLLASHHLLDLK